jgi:osmotically-inducible protein OsmY
MLLRDESFVTALCARASSLCLAVALAGCAPSLQRGLFESPADARISAQVRTVLAQSAALGEPNLISVRTQGGVVYLRGLVSTPYQIEAAGSLAATVAGASHIENLLSIDNAR